MSNWVVRNAGSITGKSNGDPEERVTEPLDDGETTTVEMLIK